MIDAQSTTRPGASAPPSCYSGAVVRCLEENTLFEYVSDGLDLAARDAIAAHAASCDACRRMIAAAVDAAPSHLATAHPAAITEPGSLPALAGTPGRTIAGKYQLLRLIGSGGMGVVHEAINTWTGRRVAVKELNRAFSSDDHAVQRFTLEAKSASRIAHPNVVDILDLGRDPETGALFMVQELLIGSTLRERLVGRGALAIDEVVRILGPALAALVVAHDAGVVHRDLKPDNIFLARDAFDGEVTKLIDFGLSKQLRPDPALDVTGHGRQLGTPYYMSPEQLRGELDLDDRTDVWSMGVVLFEAIAGARPFTGPSYHELVVQILKDPVPRLIDVLPTVPAAISALVARALERDPAARLRSRELRDALDELGRRPDVLAVPRGNPYRGLLPFEQSYRGVFFGRAAEVAAVIERFRHSPFVLVAGDSGVGKSSLIRAGVLPVVGDAAIRVAITTPGPQPVAAIAAALAPILDADPGALAAQLADDAAAVGAALQRTLAPDARSAVPRLVLFVDQLEELVTLADGGEAAFAALALVALLEAAPALRLIATVRSDFLARLATLPGLGDEVTRALYLLVPLSRQGVREAIVGPARVTGLRFESAALVDELVASAGSSAGELPLLQFALAQLWDARDAKRGILCAASLASLGGVAGALAGHADRVLALIPPRHVALAREILTGLVTQDGTRARKTAGELRLGDAAPEAVQIVLETLVQGRLLSVEDRDGAPSYQIAHDVLVEGWGTLRGWRGGDVERGVARQRLARAAAEWERLGRPGDALWKGKQLTEADALAPGALAAIDAEFLARSRRAVRNRRYLRHAVVLGIPALLGLGFTGARIIAHRRTAEAVAAHVDAAEAAIARAGADERALDQLRSAAFAAFDHGHSAPGEAAWAQVLARQDALDATYRGAGEHLEAAHELDAGDRDVRRRFAALLYDRAVLAERTYRPVERDELVHRMEAYDDDGAQHARWNAPARLVIASTPDHATVVAQRVETRTLTAPVVLGTTPLSGAALPPGSYLITLRAPGRPEVRAPLALVRGEAVTLTVPMPSAVPAGYVFVPPGRFLYGSSDSEDMRRTMMNAQPLHLTTTAGYLIARHEVTFGDWIAFVRTLPADERARRLPYAAETAATAAGAIVALTEPAPGRFHLKLQPTSRTYAADDDQPIHYASRTTGAEQRWLRMPVSGISWPDALAYAAWLDHSGALPGARPCDEHEWERAARGADGRLFPAGDRLEPADANFAETYGRQTDAFGPDEVGAHPASDSPFGVADLAGNVWEWVASVTGDDQVAIRGGSWYHNPLAARSNNREPSEPSLRAIAVGLRICGRAPAR
jgi:eukaryotic-like serine/threonine-protein kinase